MTDDNFLHRAEIFLLIAFNFATNDNIILRLIFVCDITLASVIERNTGFSGK